MVNRENLLNLYPALSSIPNNALDALLPSVMNIPAGSEIFAERHPCQGFPLLLAGRIKVVKQASNGREMVLYRVGPGGSCLISSSCLLGHSDYNARGIAEQPLTLLAIPAKTFSTWIVEHLAFRDFVFHLFTERITELMQLVEEIAFNRLDQRLAKLILARNTTVIHISHQQLADELGSVREIVSRLLKGFALQELVTLGREQLSITDRQGLQKIAAM